MTRLIVLFILLPLLGNTPKMEGTNWASHFYHYHNNYFFETDSTGYSEDGQVAWSCPIDTTELGISGNTIVYNDPEPFQYVIIDEQLIISYRIAPNETKERRFHFDIETKGWLSTHEYAYGREVLKEESRSNTY